MVSIKAEIFKYFLYDNSEGKYRTHCQGHFWRICVEILLVWAGPLSLSRQILTRNHRYSALRPIAINAGDVKLSETN